MPGNFKTVDVRVQKTNKALMGAMSKLLWFRNFNQITVHDLCEEAKVGRATFYSHFSDKYDLLKQWLAEAESDILSQSAIYKDRERQIDDLLDHHGKVIKHLTEGANNETLGLICNFLLSLLNINRAEGGEVSLKHIAVSHFCCGGIINYLEWQSKNKSKADLKEMNLYFYDILGLLYQWNERQMKNGD